jgi:hypothetical protein
MKMPELLPLPTAQMNVEVWDSEARGLHSANAAYYTPDQLLAYARAYGELVRQECAKAVSDEALEDPCETPDDMAYNQAIEDCAAAIRRTD